MLVTNGAAGVVQKYAYDAYGNNYEGSFAGSNNIGYNGKRYDSGTGWYDYGFRNYDSRTGRFTTQDPIRDGMNWYAYCGGDPINHIDFFGLEINLSNLNSIEKKEYKKAEKALLKTERGKELINTLKNDSTVFTIKINNKGNNSYSPLNKEINWDPDRRIVTKDDGELSAPTLLAHEMGHAEQDLKGDLLLYPTEKQRLEIEKQNLKNTENPIAKERDEGIREDYYDWKYTIEDGKLYELNQLYYDNQNNGIKGK